MMQRHRPRRLLNRLQSRSLHTLTPMLTDYQGSRYGTLADLRCHKGAILLCCYAARPLPTKKWPGVWGQQSLSPIKNSLTSVGLSSSWKYRQMIKSARYVADCWTSRSRSYAAGTMCARPVWVVGWRGTTPAPSVESPNLYTTLT